MTTKRNEVGGEIEEEPNTAVVDEPIYVAVSKDVKESKFNLIWAIQNSGGKKICILFVHVPATMIPFMGTKLPASSLNDQKVQAFWEIERKNMHETLDDYLRICQRKGVRAEKLHIEMDNIEKGIIELISQHGIRKLIMGAASDKYYSRRMMDLRSRKAIYVCEHAPASCDIQFICKGYFIHAREESKAIEKVVEHVTPLLDNTDLFVADHPVGLESRVHDVIQLLNSQKSNDTLLLGIWGMGAIAKTTLAEFVYNEVRHDFDGESFLFNVGEVWKLDNSKVSLQQRLLSDIYKTTEIKIDTVDSGKMILSKILRGKRIFLVLDDVNEFDQLNALCGNRNWFGEGSKIIITTRNEDLLIGHQVDHVYKIKEMDESESIKLFNWHAFKQPILKLIPKDEVSEKLKINFDSFYCLSSIFEDLKNLQRLWLKCDSEAQLNQTLASILYSFSTRNCEGFSAKGTSASIHSGSQVCISSSKNSLTSLLIQMGMSCDITNILKEKILQQMPPIGSGLLPGDNYPDWLTFNSNSSSVIFEVPQVYGRSLKKIMCIAYSSSPNNTITDGFEVLLVINYTKNSIQVYKRDGLLDSSDEEEWQRVIANIEPGNKIEVVVVFTNEFTVKKTTIYLVYDEPIQERTNHCHEPDENTQIDKLEEDIQQMKSLTTLVADSTAITKTQMYDVFLSFRGEDCCPKFISNLDSSLQNAGIVVFKDNHGIHRGDQIFVSLLQAISQSRICIVVLSTNYANSTWCMVELERIVEISRIKGGMMVVPVFYEVDPSDVRNQTGMFGEEFDSLISTKKVDEKTKRIWKAALNEVGGRAGGVVIKNSRNESEAIKKIVELVTLLLDKTELFVADHPVGLKSRVQDVIQLLNSQKSKEPLLLGIWGMGGIGKTTIAKAVYNEIHHDFEAKSFLLNVRESWKLDSDKVALQQQLLSDIYKIKKIKIDTVKSGKMILQERLCEKKILIVIDDADNLDQMNALCGNRKWFGEGSRIIITTRNEDLLGRLEVDHVYRMKEMDDSEALELFNWHAFKQPIPRAGFTNLSRDVVKYSGGLPLALQVIGSFLLTRRREAEWKSVLEKLNLIPNVEVTEKLKISFDCLKDYVKDLFLDIAFFFIGMDREDVTEILKDCGNFPEIGISVLIQQSLVTVDRKNKIEMHDLLRSMGREIVRKKSIEGGKEPSRLWRYEDVLELSKDTSTLDVKGLTLKMSRMDSTTYLETKAFEKMDKLRFLQLSGVQLVGDYKYLSKELKWLSWHGFPLKFIPADFYQDSLVAVELKYSNLERVWRESQLLVKLKILNLSHSYNLRHTPDFSNLPNLEKLILKDCPSLSSVSSNIGQLKKILLINLKDCRGLRKLPRSIYKLDSLKTLILSGCTKIDKLEEDIEQMKSLTTLVADKTAITRVPFAVVRLKSIAYISLCDFEGFTRTVFPSIIKSWLSPTNKILSLVQTFAGTLCLDITDEQNNNFYCLSSIFEHLQDLHCLWLKCDSEAQLNQTVASILYSFNTQNYEGFSIIGTSASIQSRIQASISSSKNSLTSFLIQMGVSCNVANILRENILQKMPRVGTGLLPGDNYPDWLTFNSSGSSVTFEAPQVVGRSLKTIMCIAYSLSPDKNIIEGFKVVLVINCTKNIIQVYKIGALLASFDDDEWQRVISNIEPGNEIKVVVVFTNEFIVKETTIYLGYDEPIEEKTNHRHEADENGIVSSNVLNIFARHFSAIPSLARTVLTSRPFWFCLAGIMVWSSRCRSEKQGRDNPILREVASTSSQVFNSPESLDKNPLVDLQEVKRIG